MVQSHSCQSHCHAVYALVQTGAARQPATVAGHLQQGCEFWTSHSGTDDCGRRAAAGFLVVVDLAASLSCGVHWSATPSASTRQKVDPMTSE